MPRTKRVPDPTATDASLTRLGGGRWQTRDERFTIEPQSGTWVVVDAEQTDELGMALVRGPFRSLTEAKAAIGAARAGGPAASPLARQRKRGGDAEGADAAAAGRSKAPMARTAATATPRKPARTGTATHDAAPRAGASIRAAAADAEPSWMADLGPADRGRARRLIEALGRDGVADAESIVRRDLAGGVPALASLAIGRRLAALGPAATPDDVAALLADGRDDALDVRWRLVDGGGRPIALDAGRRGTKRAGRADR